MTRSGRWPGWCRLPELRTLRPRLGEIAETCDPLALQADLARAMLNAEAPLLGLYFVDDHFVPYEGAKPVGKGYNTKRRHAQKGLADTLVTDYHGRAVCFVSGPAVGADQDPARRAGQLRRSPAGGEDHARVRPGRVVCAGVRATAATTTWTGSPTGAARSPTPPPRRAGTGGSTAPAAPRAVTLADEMITIKDYGPARQLTLFEHDQPVLQVLTSDLHRPARGAAGLAALPVADRERVQIPHRAPRHRLAVPLRRRHRSRTPR